LVIKTLDSELNPDPQLEKILDPDPHQINADPQPCPRCIAADAGFLLHPQDNVPDPTD
jgi:hypothetical protein